MKLALAFLCFALAVEGCTYGTARHPVTSTEPLAASDVVPASTDPWIEGKLPPDVMEGTPRRGGTLVVRMQAEPPSLDLITDSDLIATWILDRKVYEEMAELDASKHPDYPLKPVLATSWTISPDGQTFTFHIRHGVKWHDGYPFSGQDVVATVKKILDPNVRAMALRSEFQDLDDIHTLPGDDFTVVAHYKRRYFMAFRALATLPIYPKHILDVAGDMLSHPIHRAPVGTGPFKFVSWDTTNEKIIFERNEDYWGRKAYVDRVVYHIVKDSTVAYQMLLQGDFDLYTTLTSSMWVQEMPQSAYLRAHYNRIKFYTPNYSWIGWNELRPMFADARVRLALTYLLDREGMREQYLLGTDRSTTCHFYDESANCDHSLKPRPYDPAKGVALLNEAGWIDHDGDGIRDKNGVPFKFTFLIPTASTTSTKFGAYMQSAYRKVGIQMDIKRVDWSIYIQALREHTFDACFLLWGNTDVVTDPYSIWDSSQSKDGSNFISYNNPRADALIQQARGEMDDAKRAALFRQFGRILYDDNPYTWLYVRPSLDAVRKTVHGIRPSVAWYDLQDVWFSK